MRRTYPDVAGVNPSLVMCSRLVNPAGQPRDTRPGSLDVVSDACKTPINGVSTMKRTVLQWPVLRQYNGPVDHEIEPGESDLITITFVVPCQSAQYARVATDIEKTARKPQRSSENTASSSYNVDTQTPSQEQARDAMVWKARTSVDIGSLCKKE